MSREAEIKELKKTIFDKFNVDGVDMVVNENTEIIINLAIRASRTTRPDSYHYDIEDASNEHYSPINGRFLLKAIVDKLV